MKERTKALAISAETRRRVKERDGCCVLCFLRYGRLNAYRLECAHYIGRGQSGLGIPENLVMLCPKCHRAYDQSAQRGQLRELIEEHLRNIYEDWDEIPKTYDKWRI